MKNLRNYCLNIFCILLPSLCFAQAPVDVTAEVKPNVKTTVDVNTEIKPYILVYQDFKPWNIYRLNTSNGEMVQVKDDTLIKVEGCPDIPEEERYNGRFSFFQDRVTSFATFLLIDHKSGQLWILAKNRLIPIPEAE